MVVRTRESEFLNRAFPALVAPEAYESDSALLCKRHRSCRCHCRHGLKQELPKADRTLRETPVRFVFV